MNARSRSRTLAAALAASSLLAAGADARADSKQECAAAYEKVQSFREQGKLRDARAEAVTCSAPTCSVYVTKDCTQWLAEIEASLPTVVLVARDATGTDTAAVRVIVDGRVLAERLDGKAVALDPGEHVVRFEMDGAAAVEHKVLIRQGEKNRTLSVSFQGAPPTPPAPRPPAPPPPAPAGPPSMGAPAPQPPVPPAPEPAARRGVPVWAWVSGAGGLALLGVGAAFGVSGLEAQSDLVSKCGGNPAQCPASTSAVTVPLADRRTQDRNVFIGLAAAGVVAIGAAVIGIVQGTRAPAARSGLVVVPLGVPSGGGVGAIGVF